MSTGQAQCAGHGWLWGTRGHTDGALTLFPLEGSSPPSREQMYMDQAGPMSPMSLHKSKVPAGEGAAGCSPSELSWVTLLESKPRDGSHSQHPFAS